MGSSQSRQKSTRSSTQKMNAAFSWQPGGERLEREALVLAAKLVGGVDLDVAARAQRSFVAQHTTVAAAPSHASSRAEQNSRGCERGTSCAGDERAQEENQARARKARSKGARGNRGSSTVGPRRPQKARDGGTVPGRGECATAGPHPATERATGRTREGESRRAAELQASATGRACERVR